MATAAVESNVMQNYAKPENGGVPNGPGGAVQSDDSRIHDLIFVMVQENPNPESGIQQAMKLLASLNEDLFRVTQQVRERQFEQSQAYGQLRYLEYREKSFRMVWTDNGKRVASLKQDLDTPTFANNAYKERAIKPEEKINNHNLYFPMHHGTNNMRDEKKLLKEINGSKKEGDHSDSGLSTVDEISDRIRKLRWDIRRSYIFRAATVVVDEKQVLKEINDTKWTRDKAFANAPLKGRTWNSLPSKSAIRQQIKLMEQASCDEDRKEHLQLRAKIEVLKQAINVAKRDMGSLKRKLLNIRGKKGEA